MKSFIRTSAVSLVVIIAVAILLPVLAVLQYRWLGEVSQAERERLQAAVHAGAEQFRQDFDQEILRVFLTFQLESSIRDPDIRSELQSRYDSWVSDVPHAKLVRAILVAKKNPDGSFRLARFHPASADLQACDWPDELLPWRDRIERAQKSLPPQVREAVENILGGKLQVSGASRATILTNLAPFIADEVPALFIPTMSRANLNDITKKKQPFFVGYTIVELDSAYVRGEFLPALAMKRFGSDNRLDYNIDVVRRAEPLKPVFQSDPRLQLATPSTSDTAMELFSLRIEDLRALPIRDLLQGGRRGGPGGVALRGGVTMNLYTAPANASVRAASTPPRIDEGRWLLLVTHRAGSLEAAVGRVRQRNLIVSAGVLSLLVASVALVVGLAQRSRRLARQQMIFVAGVSHELRTPLTVIRSAGDNLAGGIIVDGPRVRHYGELIRTEGQRLSEMVEQILEFSGIRSRPKEYDLRPMEVASLIEAALAGCRLTRKDSDFQVERSVESPLPMVMGDAAALCGALQNLLRNAMKYSLDQRWIGIAAHTLGNGRRGEIEITIEDRGIGIASGDLPHIFEPFYRGKAVVENQIHGNGLGLSLVKHIVEAHKGKVSVKSTLGKGTAFTVHLPIAKADPNQSSINSARTT